MADSTDRLEALEKAITEVVRPEAPRVDASGEFPAEGVKALAATGVLGMTISPDAGGDGRGCATRPTRSSSWRANVARPR